MKVTVILLALLLSYAQIEAAEQDPCDFLPREGDPTLWMSNPEAAREILKKFYAAVNAGCSEVTRNAIQQNPDLHELRKRNPDARGAIKALEVDCASIFDAINVWIKTEGNTDIDRELLESYDARCQHKLQPAESKQIAAISAVLGVLRLYLPGNEYDGAILCTATQISPRHVITALHCLRNVYASAGSLVVLEPKQVAFSALREPKRITQMISGYMSDYAKPKDFLSGRNNDQRYDYIVFEMAQVLPFDIAVNPIQIERANTGTTSYILPGFNSLLAYTANIRVLPSKAQEVAASWPSFIRFGDMMVCRVQRIEAGVCFFHSCPAVPGMSGAPLFFASADSQTLRLAGIHSGGVMAESCPGRRAVPTGDTNAYPNLGNMLDPSWIKTILGG
jgi:V8-like Glu-specific endopeptidase